MLAYLAFACKLCIPAYAALKLHLANGIAGVAMGLHLQGVELYFAIAHWFAVLLNINKLPMDKVGFHNMLCNFDHELHVPELPRRPYLGKPNNLEPMHFDCNICSMVGLIVTKFIAFAIYALVDLLLRDIPFDLCDSYGSWPLCFCSLVEWCQRSTSETSIQFVLLALPLRRLLRIC